MVQTVVSVTTEHGGTTDIGANVTTTGAQTFNDAVSLTAATALTSSGGAAISLNSTVNGAFTLAVNTTGATTFAGVVGADGGERDDRRRGYDEHRRERDHHGPQPSTTR